MKTIGMIGGMSWESTAIYYEKVNTYVKEMVGADHSAQILMYSFDYRELEVMLENNQWQAIEARLIEVAKQLEAMGSDMIMILANTMHIVADAIESQLRIPLVHIVKTARNEAKKKNLRRVLLLGTRYTMESTIYPQLFNEVGIELITPSKRDQAMIHRVIYNELIKGQFLEKSRQNFLDVIHRHDIDGVILGCTEIPLLIQQHHLTIPILDTLDIHARHAVMLAVE